MRFAFDEETLLFRDSLRDFLAKECTPELLRSLWTSETGHATGLWKKLAELGVAGLLVPEAHEGMGRDERDLALLLEEAGRAAAPELLISTAAVGAPLLAEAGDAALAERWLPALVRGEALLAVGHPASPFVGDAHVADLLLLPHGEDELHAVPAREVRLEHQPANDPARRLYTVSWQPAQETRIADGARGRALRDAALDRGALACAAELVGVTEKLLELAVSYAGQRQQFGRPIGTFQALQHAMADVKVALEYARPVVHRAADSVARGLPLRARDVSMAKAAATAAAQAAARIALQVHGAIGYTWEQDLHIWMRRAWSLALAWGTARFHPERVAGAVLEDGAPIGPGTTFAGD